MAGKALAIRLLGPVEARLGTVQLNLGSRQERLILAVLALAPGTVVPLDRLLGLVWPAASGPLTGPPRTARAAVQVAISRLQTVLAEHATIVGDGSGYRLDLIDAWTDVATFHRLTQQARDSADPIAARLLAEADRLWRGPALAGITTPEVRERLCRGLQERRLVATEDRFDALLRLDRHREILEDLQAAVTADPLRERLVAQLMLALHRVGRSSAALELFEQTARALDRDRGLQPGSALTGLRELIVADAPELCLTKPRASLEALDARPSGLPRPDGQFLGRGTTMCALNAAATAAAATGSGIVVLTGPGGIGKTQTALQWAQRNREHYPDGQLYVDLRGHSAGRALRPVDVLAGFLRALGTGIRQIPSEPDEAAAAFRSAVRGRRVLIVLDNAADHAGTAAQIDPLLPGDPGCFVLITSRDPLEALVLRETGRRIAVPELEPQASVQLLQDHSAPVDPESASALARRCGYLPLALRVAAAVLHADPDLPIGDLLAEFDGAPTDPARAAFVASYRRLPPREQRTFRLLGLVPGADFSIDAAAALTRLPAAQIEAALQRLVQLNLLTAGPDDRFALHDLMGRYANELAAEDAESATARARLAEWYEMMTATATGLLFPQHRVMLPGSMPVEGGRFADNAAAMHWLEREFGNLVALITASAQYGPRSASWRVTAALSPYLRTDIPAAPIRLIAAAAASAAQVVEDLPGQAVANMTLAAAAKLDNEHDVTERHLRRARRLALRAGWLSGEATALRLQGNLYGNLQRIRAAVRCCEESLGVFHQLGDLGGQAINLHNSGMMYFLLGDLPHARERAEQALAHYESIGSLTGSSKALAALVQVDIREGRTAAAMTRAERARELAERSEDLRALEFALTTLAELQHILGDHTAAEQTLATARTTGTTNPYTAIIAAHIGAGIAYVRQDYGRAVAETEDALATAIRLNAASFVTQLQLRRSAGLLRIGNADAALAAAGEGIDNAVTHEFGILHGLGLIELAWIRLAREELEQALRAAREALETGRRLGDHLGVAHAQAALSAVFEHTGDQAEARLHRRAAADFFDATGIPNDLRRLTADR